MDIQILPGITDRFAPLDCLNIENVKRRPTVLTWPNSTSCTGSMARHSCRSPLRSLANAARWRASRWTADSPTKSSCATRTKRPQLATGHKARPGVPAWALFPRPRGLGGADTDYFILILVLLKVPL